MSGLLGTPANSADQIGTIKQWGTVDVTLKNYAFRGSAVSVDLLLKNTVEEPQNISSMLHFDMVAADGDRGKLDWEATKCGGMIPPSAVLKCKLVYSFSTSPSGVSVRAGAGISADAVFFTISRDSAAVQTPQVTSSVANEERAEKSGKIDTALTRLTLGKGNFYFAALDFMPSKVIIGDPKIIGLDVVGARPFPHVHLVALQNGTTNFVVFDTNDQVRISMALTVADQVSQTSKRDISVSSSVEPEQAAVVAADDEPIDVKVFRALVGETVACDSNDCQNTGAK